MYVLAAYKSSHSLIENDYQRYRDWWAIVFCALWASQLLRNDNYSERPVVSVCLPKGTVIYAQILELFEWSSLSSCADENPSVCPVGDSFPADLLGQADTGREVQFITWLKRKRLVMILPCQQCLSLVTFWNQKVKNKKKTFQKWTGGSLVLRRGISDFAS